MAQVALLGHAKPKNKRTKSRISKLPSVSAVANTWWDPSSLPNWLTEQCYAENITFSQRQKNPRDSGGNEGLRALCSVHPLGPTSCASKARQTLAGLVGISR